MNGSLQLCLHDGLCGWLGEREGAGGEGERDSLEEGNKESNARAISKMKMAARTKRKLTLTGIVLYNELDGPSDVRRRATEARGTCQR